MRTWKRLLLLLLPLALVAAACGDDDDEEATPETTVAETDDGGDDGDSDGATITDIAVDNPDLTVLVEALGAAGLDETLAGEGPFTVFAPNDTAFEDAFTALELTQEDLIADTETLTDILTYHVVPDTAAMSGDLTDGMEVTTVQGGTLTIGVSDDGVTVTDATGQTVDVITADVEASNGVVHVIDGVLLPG